MPSLKYKSVSTSWIRSRKRRHLSDAAERLWMLLLLESDSYGDVEAYADDLLRDLFGGVPGWTEAKVEKHLTELHDAGLIVRWNDGDRRPWANIVDHDLHQSTALLRKRGPRKSGGFAGRSRPSTDPGQTGHAITRQELELDQTRGPSNDGLRPKRVSSRPPSETAELIEQARTKLGDLAGFADELVDLLAGENKSGTVAASRALRLLWTPLADLVADTDRSALAYGLRAAVQNGAPNVNYVRKAAAGYGAPRDRNLRALPEPGSAGSLVRIQARAADAVSVDA